MGAFPSTVYSGGDLICANIHAHITANFRAGVRASFHANIHANFRARIHANFYANIRANFRAAPALFPHTLPRKDFPTTLRDNPFRNRFR